jgi:hypothetical protein
MGNNTNEWNANQPLPHVHVLEALHEPRVVRGDDHPPLIESPLRGGCQISYWLSSIGVFRLRNNVKCANP